MTEEEIKRLKELDSRFEFLNQQETDEWLRLMKKYHNSQILML